MLVAGLPTVDPALDPVGPGSGAVTIDNNRIQGNMAGAGDGGGIALRTTMNDLITITNNVIVNNVTGLAGGGISMQDAANVNIIEQHHRPQRQHGHGEPGIPQRQWRCPR